MDNLLKNFFSTKEIYESLITEIIYILKEQLQFHEVKFSSVHGRIKTIESFLEKIERKNYNNPFIDITDIAGVRLVYVYKNDLELIENIIQDSFNIIERVDQSESYSADQFGYESIHYLLKLNNKFSGPRYDNLKNYTCELQIRTILQDAWAIVSHHIEYKKKSSAPKQLSKDLHALAGTFEIVDAHLVKLREDRNNYLKKIQSEQPYKLLQEEINRESLLEYLKQKFPDMELVASDDKELIINSFPSMLKKYNLKNILDIENILKATEKARIAFNEDENFGKAAYRELFIGLALINRDFRDELGLKMDKILVEKYEYLVENWNI